jgi:mono/diheme cytochrome c family protein
MRTFWAVRMGALAAVIGGVLAVSSGFTQTVKSGEKIVKSQCVHCHRTEGKPESRFKLEAPDLMWGGSKYQRSWLVDWLTGKEPNLYAKGYRWDLPQWPLEHVTVSQPEAEAIADYFEQHLVDSRVKIGAMDLSTFTATEAEFGRKIFKEHACIGCHQIEENGKIVGGPQSTSLVEAGRRYKADWLYRFGINPQDYVPHSGEFLADASGLGLRYIIGFVAIQGRKDFRFYEPWTSAEFAHASVDRGKLLYKEYCAQCHGATGRGDGPAASGLEPKPAVHANIRFEKLPMEYLYNVIYHGGRSVGKSPNMPYWGLTIGQQGVADVIAYLKDTFKGDAQVAQAPPIAGGVQSGDCPQLRSTAKAPEEFLKMTNPLPASSDAIRAGKTLFLQTAQPLACAQCHGEKGDGKGLLGAALVPPPRNFTCGKTMKDLPDGQLFWVIKNGSSGTGMMAFSGLSDAQVWQVIQYIRNLAQ